MIAEITDLDTLAPYTSAKCALISPVVNPREYNDSTISSTLPRRRWRFATICGRKLPSRSRGTSISTGPTASEITVLVRTPFRELAPLRPSTACFSYPR